MMIFRVSGIHDFAEKRVFQIHVFSLSGVRVGGEPRHEPLHADAQGRFGISITPLDKRRADDRQARGGGSPIGKLGPAQLAHHAQAEDKREHGKRQTEAQDHAPQRRHAFVGELVMTLPNPKMTVCTTTQITNGLLLLSSANPVATSPPLSEQARKAR